jgi:glutamate/tyrosine decarboxylase-like PLP-dependent enzyme
MRADRLPALSNSSIVCLQAGNVNTGALDPAGVICEAAWVKGAWVHVDGAFGLWAAAAPGRAHLAEGYERADSWATDAHKWLNVPYDCGIVLVREPDLLEAAMATSASYLAQGAQRHPFRYTPEMSRRARSVPLWAALRTLGRTGVAQMVERCCRLAARFAEGLRGAGYAVLNDVVLNQVLVSFGAPELTNAVIAEIQRDGTCWCGGTVWQGQTAMRISVSSWASTEEDVEKSLAAIIRIASRAAR